ncbi:MAG: AraC family transcriptional regulator [Chloroflexi bacterium]|nr:AraC family transcriptional regulator [Chloroflexota bacterium]OJV93272.1 MAG: AraC family transcriptional regulator [Chloroflexi bacterium 54-19]
MNLDKISVTKLNNYEMTEIESNRLETGQRELAERIGRTLRDDGRKEVLPGLTFHRTSNPSDWSHGVISPTLCVIAQGSKEILLGELLYRYDPAHYLIATAELPVVSQVLEASQDQPYLSLTLKLDPTLVSSVIVEAGQQEPQNRAEVKAINVSPLDADLLDAIVRLVRLADTLEDAPMLAPLVTREIIYRLLKGEQGERLRHLTLIEGQLHRIIKIIEKIRKDYNKPLRMDIIAQDCGMSVSGFHHHFKAVTAMSPLQFQKQLRLQEARRLILTEKLDATSAGYRVGYEDASHFSREYKNLFGNPPMRDAAQLRETVGQYL